MVCTEICKSLDKKCRKKIIIGRKFTLIGSAAPEIVAEVAETGECPTSLIVLCAGDLISTGVESDLTLLTLFPLDPGPG
jgi:hypothetical protein